jgi:hypothetical protein
MLGEDLLVSVDRRVQSEACASAFPTVWVTATVVDELRESCVYRRCVARRDKAAVSRLGYREPHPGEVGRNNRDAGNHGLDLRDSEGLK